MNIFDYTLKHNPFPSNKHMLEILKENFCFLDIETTGFSRKKDRVILIGLLFKEGPKYKLRQYFLENPSQEKELLRCFIDDLSKFDLMITYNGLSFDYPFIQERTNQHLLPLQLKNLKHIDLYKHIQKKKQSLPLENFQLKTVEKLLGIYRKDGISGGESVTLYDQYIQNKNLKIRDEILLHNYEDIFYLPLITGVFAYFPDSPFLVNSLHHSVSLSSIENPNQQELTFVMKMNDIKLKDYKISITGKTKTLGEFQKINLFEKDFNFSWSPDKEQYQLDVLMYTEILDPDTRVHYFNFQEILTAIDKFSSAEDSARGSVDNNIIMYINFGLNYEEALGVIPTIIKNIFRKYLFSSQ
ncbi:ribonuclease H-like domain-containing protein [Isachenkonia alkalipeptolytica]|uniref:YprB ribonuclease H-like domain-containing protein n=1 Tax=Isachenkonia alkalipeptolytica TaxID=2565777 RepID=A0AA44BE45_9CLOT|nr:ribonuclease H-like domain-containing protein [Isachenkonia alkalipeptolytica]NBG88979.1 hypothetical protein [Isachenkonia alkalipeptolytica]